MYNPNVPVQFAHVDYALYNTGYYYLQECTGGYLLFRIGTRDRPQFIRTRDRVQYVLI